MLSILLHLFQRYACAFHLLLFMSCGMLAGCGPSTSQVVEGRESTAELASQPSVHSIDVGVIFADESNYVCIPLSRLGIDEDQAVTDVTSSCDCTRPSIIAYQTTRDKTARGLRVDFVQEDQATEAAAATVMPLAVVINVRLNSGRSISATLEFLHTRRNAKLDASGSS